MGCYLLAFALVHRNEHRRYMSLALGTMLGVEFCRQGNATNCSSNLTLSG
jgi:hypothetical protein